MAKHDLAKLALAALVLAANATELQADEGASVQDGILLAAGCSAHGCGAGKKNDVSDTTTNSNPYSSNSQYGASNSSYGTSTYGNPASSNAYGSPSYGSSNYNQDRSGSYGASSTYNSDWEGARSSRGGSADWNANRTYGSSATDSYSATPGAYGTTTVVILSDDDFRNQLSSDNKKVFDSLSRSGKDLAKSLSNDSKYQDKNAAVKEAQKRTQGGSSTSPTSSTYNR